MGGCGDAAASDWMGGRQTGARLEVPKKELAEDASAERAKRPRARDFENAGKETCSRDVCRFFSRFEGKKPLGRGVKGVTWERKIG